MNQKHLVLPGPPIELDHRQQPMPMSIMAPMNDVQMAALIASKLMAIPYPAGPKDLPSAVEMSYRLLLECIEQKTAFDVAVDAWKQKRMAELKAAKEAEPIHA